MEKISVLICTGISTKTTGKCMCIYPLFTYLLMVWPSHYLAGYQIPPQNGWEVVFLIQAHSSLLGDVEQNHEMLESIAQFEHALLNTSAAWYVGDGSHGAREGMTRMGSILLRFLQPSYLATPTARLLAAPIRPIFYFYELQGDKHQSQPTMSHLPNISHHLKPNDGICISLSSLKI